MNWSRVKTILIILFLCTDMILLGIYFTSKYSSSTISDEVIESTVAVLNNNDITIDPSIIPRKMPTVPYAEAENVISDYETFAKAVLGDGLSEIEYGYESNRGKITFYGDRFNFTVNPVIFALTDMASISNESLAEEMVVTGLKNWGFNLENAEISTVKTGDGFSVMVENTANSLPMFNSQVTAVLSEYGVTSISGIWFNEIASDGNSSELRSITSALMDFIPEASGKTEITAIEYGYSILDNSMFHKSATLIPVWEVTAKDGTTHILDGRNL